MDSVQTLESLTKRQTKRLLHELGRSNAGSKTELLVRLKASVPETCAGWIGTGPSLHAADAVLVDREGQKLDLDKFKVPAKILEEPSPTYLPIHERFRNAQVVGDLECLARWKPVKVNAPLSDTSVGKKKKEKETGKTRNETRERAEQLACELWEGKTQDIPGELVVVLGDSGAGKTCFLEKLNECFGGGGLDDSDVSKWDPSRAIISQFGTQEEGVRWLMAAGLTSIPSWCKPFHILSTGERYRAQLARKLQYAHMKQRVLILDDFTSHLDRVTAKACAAGLAKQTRRLGLACVLGCSVVDVVEWLQPDRIVSLPHFKILTIDCHSRTGPFIRIHVDRQNVCRALDDPHAQVPAVGQIPGSVLNNPEAESHLKSMFRFNIDEEKAPEGGTVLHSTVTVDQATQMCDKLFDRAFDGECCLRIPPRSEYEGLLEEFSIGVITGPSGSAKSVMLRHLFSHPSHVEWNSELSLADHFPSPEHARARLLLVELAPEVYATKHIEELSSGERERAALARLLDESNVCVDEFTSVLDRDTALRMARNVSAFLKTERAGARFVFVTCHSDVIPVLRPDWVLDTVSGVRLEGYEFGQESDGTTISGYVDQLLESPVLALPVVEFSLERCEAWVWCLFRDHHYKTKNLSPRARTFVLRHGSQLVGFIASIKQVGKHRACEGDHEDHATSNKRQRVNQESESQSFASSSWRAHRTVVLPSWQGLGIGSRLSDACAEIHRQTGSAYLAQTVHPRFGEYRDASPFWEPLPWNHTTQEFRIDSWKQRLENVRVKLRIPKYIYAHRYIGPQSAQDEAALGKRVAFD